MLHWNKIGHVFAQNGSLQWATDSALTPTPIVVRDEEIRVYAGFRDSEGISRIGYVDVAADDPRNVLRVSQTPVLDRGRDGCFDDNGVIMGDVVKTGDRLRMYYVGFQQVKRAKFLAFSGVAESIDGGETFQRLSEAPVMDRVGGGTTIRAIHTAMQIDGAWRVWYAVGDRWEMIGGVPFPQYNIWTTTSPDGIQFTEPGTLCVDNEGAEYRIGRPSVYRHGDGYMMFYTKGTKSGSDYFPGVAFSADGVRWERCDHELGLELSPGGFDSMHLCYPRLVEANGRTLCFYNGNNMGKEGFGVAELL
ncbi:putative GH43/DUF377 family glycosyl hydrolase [Pseudorhizobium tarimense]|uniref:GH43/DUF377 family glycosyl hydrolase n=1 Tax=Pseudorhizobium tarimense TaxID=1079109 RepID=A0ABV2H5P3_9HYPH|nr:hypothetical protein [Pseudorhizobium tarimense]MCJ8519289.1 hypothetical protein [Pseudorhizobium tarimense]